MKKICQQSLLDMATEHMAWLHNDGGRQIDLSGYDLTGLWMQGLTMINGNFKGTNFAKCDMQNIFMKGANIESASFVDADLYRADLSETNAIRANFKHTNMTDCVMWKSDLSYATVEFANLFGADLTGTKLRGISFRGSNLQFAKGEFSIYSNGKISAIATRWDVMIGNTCRPIRVFMDYFDDYLKEYDPGTVRILGAWVNSLDFVEFKA